MDHNSNKNNNNRFSFFQLFKGTPTETVRKFKIVVPIIQRDYAQGRTNDSAEDVRNEFLQSLKDYILDENRESHDLDFVYGYTETSQKDRDTFIPLDGQQRLTTLFLLHWYLAQRTTAYTDKNIFFENLISKDKCLFSYETRSSSTDFCDQLIQAYVDWDNLEKITINKKEVYSLSATIKNMFWFAPSWMQDPTIQSMLVMLDSIHHYFKEENHTYCLSRLMADDSPAVTFIFMDLDENGLTDDLYIKMNSRGKPLTPFENFKSKFEQYIGTIDSQFFTDNNEDIKNSINDPNNTISNAKQYFSFNIDTKWTNLMWAYCKDELTKDSQDVEKKLESLLDKKLANFVRVVLANQIPIDLKSKPQYPTNATKEDKKSIEEEDKSKKLKQRELLNILITDSNRTYVSYNTYEKNHGLSPEGVNHLISAFDVLTNGQNKILSYLNDNRYYNENEVFKMVIDAPTQKNEFIFPIRIRFYAYVKYLILFKKHPDFSSKLLNDWMHFIYNITENTIFDDAQDFSLAITAISDLLQKMRDNKIMSINEYLKSLKNVIQIEGFSNWQVQEEQIKAHLFDKSEDWNNLLLDLEGHGYLHQQIGFILEFAGIIDYFNTNQHCEWSTIEDVIFLGNVKKYGKIAKEVFGPNYENRNYAQDSIFERAMLIHYPMYVVTPNSGRRNLLSSCAGGNVKRDFSWRVLLRLTNDKSRREKVKEMFDYLQDENDIKNKLETFIMQNISSCHDEWVKAFACYPKTINFCKYGHFKITDHGCFLRIGTYDSYSDAEIFTYTLYNENNKDSTFDTTKFYNIDEHYYYAKYDNNPHIFWRFKYDNQEYSLGIYAIAPNGNFQKYQFIIKNALSLPARMPQELNNIISQLGFTYNHAQQNYDEFTLDVSDSLGNLITDYSDTRVVVKFHEIKNEILKNIHSLGQTATSIPI